MGTEIEAQRNLMLSRDTAFLPDLSKGIASIVIEDLARLALKQPDFIPMVTKSNEGITEDGFVLAQFIEHELGIPVHARVLGYCNSAATYALLTCQERIGYEYSAFVLHHQTAGMETQYDPETYDKRVDAWKKENAETLQRQLSFYMQKLGKSQDEVRSILDAGSAVVGGQIDAIKAFDLGILTKVIANKANKEPPS